jgi:K+-sensing histidine kinase KdpD
LRELALRFVADESDEELSCTSSGTSLRFCGKRPSASWRPSPRRRGPYVLLGRGPHRIQGQRELAVVHVIAAETSPPADGRSIGGLRSLTADLGARWHEIEDDDPARALVSFAHGPRAGRTKSAAMTSFSSAPAA